MMKGVPVDRNHASGNYKNKSITNKGKVIAPLKSNKSKYNH